MALPDDKRSETSAASLSADPVVMEAQKRFNRCAEWEAQFRERFLNDVKFANGDADNGYQWPNAIRRARDVDSKPCLTLNIIRQHNLMIVNDAKKNKTGVKIRGVSNGATKESAEVYEGLIRHIEYQSNATDAYSTAIEWQVEGGIGWWRIATDWAGGDGPEAWQQEIFIRRVWDPLSVYMDPDIQEKDGSDAKFAFVFDTVPIDDFDEAYPEFKERASLSPLGSTSGSEGWITKDHVMICEYFRKVQKKDRMLSFVGSDGQRKTARASKLHKDMIDALIDDPLTRIRDIWDDVVEWKLIVGEEVIDETVWLGRYIPLIRVLGEETTIEGLMDRKGHTRAMKDAQRMFNFNASSQVEYISGQGKTPWVAPAAAIEDLETYWNSANLINHSLLPFKQIDDDGNPLPPPTRTPPPTASPAYDSAMKTAFDQIMMVSGQWQNQMGMTGNERTGKAIMERQRQGDTATYHFIDNLATAIRFTGKQLVDLVPKVYDTRRVQRILAEDGTDFEIEIDPTARQAYLQHRGHNAEVIKRIFNPNVGRYDVEADMGPAYGTKRQEAFDAFTLLLTQAPGLTGIIGDLLLSAADFPLSEEAAERLKRMVPKQALGEGPTQNEMMLTKQLQQMQGLLAKALERQGKDTLKLVGKDQMRDIDSYKAETDRMAALAKMLPMEPEGLEQLITQLVHDALHTTLLPIMSANQADIGNDQGDRTAPAPDGDAGNTNWKLLDPTRRSRYLQMAPLARPERM